VLKVGRDVGDCLQPVDNLVAVRGCKPKAPGSLHRPRPGLRMTPTSVPWSSHRGGF